MEMKHPSPPLGLVDNNTTSSNINTTTSNKKKKESCATIDNLRFAKHGAMTTVASKVLEARRSQEWLLDESDHESDHERKPPAKPPEQVRTNPSLARGSSRTPGAASSLSSSIQGFPAPGPVPRVDVELLSSDDDEDEDKEDSAFFGSMLDGFRTKQRPNQPPATVTPTNSSDGSVATDHRGAQPNPSVAETIDLLGGDDEDDTPTTKKEEDSSETQRASGPPHPEAIDLLWDDSDGESAVAVITPRNSMASTASVKREPSTENNTNALVKHEPREAIDLLWDDSDGEGVAATITPRNPMASSESATRASAMKREPFAKNTKAPVKEEPFAMNTKASVKGEPFTQNTKASVKPESSTENIKAEDSDPAKTTKKEEIDLLWEDSENEDQETERNSTIGKPPPSCGMSLQDDADSEPPPPLTLETERLRHLEGIDKPCDRALQLLLWEIGFAYNVYAHQFEAIRFVAGLVPTFPLPKGGAMTSEWLTSIPSTHVRWEALRSAAAESVRESEAPPRKFALPTRGMLLADEMGLGKTIEALGGAALRARMCTGGRVLPTLIVSPQDGIQNQWYETLVKSGVSPSRIEVWGDTKQRRNRRHEACRGHYHGQSAGGRYVLCTRYNIQSELRRLFDQHHKSATGENRLAKLCAETQATTLFHNVPPSLIGVLRNQYLADKGKERNQFNLPKEKGPDAVARLVQKRTSVTRRTKSTNPSAVCHHTFQTIIVDEAHFCKNVLAYWGLGLALLGTQSRRVALLTGTPYNNGPSDMSALMTYIDPSHEAARLDWWNHAVTTTSTGYQTGAADGVGAWRKAYLLRRTKEVLTQKLPPRLRVEPYVGAMPSELWIYEFYESVFLEVLQNFKQDMESASPEARLRLKKVFEIMMACMACMRMALVHPILPNGREMTIQFSPSRKHLLKREERPKTCVFCLKDPTRAAEEHASRKTAAASKRRGEPPPGGNNTAEDDLMALVGTAHAEMDLDDDQLNDDDDNGDSNHGAKSKRDREREERLKGPIVPLGPEICQASGSRCQHFAHTTCIEKHLKSQIGGCPRCNDLKNRFHRTLPHNRYCQEITTHIQDSDQGGFAASAKIEAAIQWFQTTVPPNDKAIILSFFKGSLDLIEGILVSKFGIDCARYDGDVSKEERSRDLQRFKTSSACRVLLATVQSGGTGLNITEANHVCFLDRWFNPCVHDQAESRCHRIGQKKDVNIAYLDINLTVDIVMKRVNVLKEGNAKVVLADGTSLGDRWSLGYRNVSGVIGNTLTELRGMREEIVKDNGDISLPPYVESDLEQKLLETMKVKSQEKTESREKVKADPENVYSDAWKRLQSTLNAKSEKGPLPEPVGSRTNPVSLIHAATPSPPAAVYQYSKNGIPTLTRTKLAKQRPPTGIDSRVRPVTLHQQPFRKRLPIRMRKANENRTAIINRVSARPISIANASIGPAMEAVNRQNARASRVLAENRNMLQRHAPDAKRSASIPAVGEPTSKRGRFSQGLSAIVSQKKKTMEFLRRKKRGDL